MDHSILLPMVVGLSHEYGFLIACRCDDVGLELYNLHCLLVEYMLRALVGRVWRLGSVNHGGAWNRGGAVELAGTAGVTRRRLSLARRPWQARGSQLCRQSA